MKPGQFSIVFFFVMVLSEHGFSQSWKECNGVPVRVKYAPMGIFWDNFSLPDNSAQLIAFFSALYETRHYVDALGFGSGYQRIINGQHVMEHDNGRSDVALVDRADIDGNAGLTLKETDGCTFSWEQEHIITADVMIAADMDFGKADESRVQTTTQGTKMGAAVMLHELGHALGLEHTGNFSIMRNGSAARVPFVGMAISSGGLSSELMANDVSGISGIYKFDPTYRNLYVSSQVLRNGVLTDNNIDPTQNDALLADPLQVCVGDKVNFYVTVGNNNSLIENFDVTIYADPDLNVSNFSPDEALVVYTGSIGRTTASFPVEFTIPSSLPTGVILNIYVSLSTTGLFERKGYDNVARSRLRIIRKPGC